MKPRTKPDLHALIKSLRGKYKHLRTGPDGAQGGRVQTPFDERWAAYKNEEKDQEERKIHDRMALGKKNPNPTN